MPRERSPNRDKAFDIYKKHSGSISNRQIAEQLGEDEKKIAVWKQRDKWNVVQHSNSVVQQTSTNVVQQKKKRGAPFGSKNAKGHGAPKGNQNALGNRGGRGMPGNKNAVTTGEYESIWFDCLTEEEQTLCYAINTDTLIQIENDIRLSTLRERRMMERIRRLMDGLSEKERKVLQELQIQKKPMEVYSEKDGTSKVLMIPEANMVVTEITETEYRTIDDILKVEEALTRVQDKKTRAIALKHSIEVSRSIELEKLNLNKARLLLDIEKAKGESKGNEHVDALRQKMQERKMKHGSS